MRCSNPATIFPPAGTFLLSRVSQESELGEKKGGLSGNCGDKRVTKEGAGNITGFEFLFSDIVARSVSPSTAVRFFLNQIMVSFI